MNNSHNSGDNQRENLGGSFSVDGQNIEVDLAEFGWEGPIADAQSAEANLQDDGRVRLQKALAHAGVASRRACETLIMSGRVLVNGEVVHELGTRIDIDTDDVRVDGVPVQLDVSKLYYVLNKPRGVVSTMSDEHDRPDLSQYSEQIGERLYNVGRLDTDTSGLLVLTNDGDLAHRLAHPKFGVHKTYIAKVQGQVTPAIIQRLKDGIELEDGSIHADYARALPVDSAHHSLVEITLHSGRNRIVRRMLAAVGHPVEELVRRQFGPLSLGNLRLGELRELSHAERGALLNASEGGTEAVTAGRPGDGKGARGMRGVAAKGNPHSRASRIKLQSKSQGKRSFPRKEGDR